MPRFSRHGRMDFTRVGSEETTTAWSSQELFIDHPPSEIMLGVFQGPAVQTEPLGLQFHFGANRIPLPGISGKLCVSRYFPEIVHEQERQRGCTNFRHMSKIR